MYNNGTFFLLYLTHPTANTIPKLYTVRVPLHSVMKLYKPLHVCAYLFGIFPVVTDAGRLRIHWPGLILKAFHTVLYSVVSVIICMITFKSLMNYEKLTKKILDTRVLNIDELFGYMVITGLTATVTCQVYMLWPSVIRIINECFLNLRPLQDDITGAWQYISAFSIILFIIYEFTMYYILVTYKSVIATAFSLHHKMPTNY